MYVNPPIISLRIPSDNPLTRPHSPSGTSTPLTSASIPLPHSLDFYLDPATPLLSWTLSEEERMDVGMDVVGSMGG
ncbi:hypothetical protein CROQUDRAFT_85551 [Cronartium quercuum f. sp. fusiforme G11]|uniref:Uncharacterized protein n=1 Tax=Cronartium quercuum f. sp. fusiforme G11 TaxID=708437 RepID=A0A9P6NS71_9BASI|nr:hypothetical protein CROQUDRAFT_85551 [Cronartium quercuum f. sp. fusiforme G11]